MPENLYDEVPYPTFPGRHTHPDRLAAVAALFGMRPAPVARCRVLEIGSGDGSNLIPMAYALPESSFTGVDLAAEPIAAARRQADALGLTNLKYYAMDLRETGPELGEFDYIIAHGLYSWIPAEARDALLAVCRARLAPAGVAFVSYNVYPGRYLRQMLREMMQFHTRRTEGSSSKIAESRKFLEFLSGKSTLLTGEIRKVLSNHEGALYHDDLAPVNDPVYFWQFAEHASRHRLQYVGDAEMHQMFDHNGALEGMNLDFLEREQYLDFVKARRFRQTILCHDAVPLRRQPNAGQMKGFLFAAPARLVDGHWEGAHGVTLSSDHEDVSRIAQAVGDCWPLPVSFDDLLPYCSSAEVLSDILFRMTVYGFVEAHVFDFPCEETVTARPRASRLARLQAETSNAVASLSHDRVKLDEIGRQLLLLMDGTRDHETLARELATRSGTPPRYEVDLQSSLRWMARSALLEA